MTTADGAPTSARRPVNRLTPARVRSVQFPRAAVGRRGYSAEAVDQFVRRMAEEITSRDAAEANLRAQLDRVRRALKQWQSRQLERRDTGTHPVVTTGTVVPAGMGPPAGPSAMAAPDTKVRAVAKGTRP